ncbi:EndoU domain-containing protein [Gracilibacillus suaedae]|uniref:EndoU domain-containing protein n=1 Tax=Gracilibacillus suaedae TaxID=2820273 RepID=UPI001ABE6FEB
MGKLTVHTGPVKEYLKRMHRYYEDQEEIIEKHLSIVNETRQMLAQEDLGQIASELDALERKGKRYINHKMPVIHENLSSGKPTEPYVEAVERIQEEFQKNNIDAFTQMIRDVQPYNRTTMPKDPITGQDVANVGSEFIGTNDLYRAATGKEPFSGGTLTAGERMAAIGWSALMFVPPARLGKIGKAGRGISTVQGVKAGTASDKMKKLSELSSNTLKTTKQQVKELSAEQLRAVQDFANRLNRFNLFPQTMQPAMNGLNGVGNVRLVDEQIYRFGDNVGDVGRSGDGFGSINTKSSDDIANKTSQVNNINISERSIKHSDVGDFTTNPKTNNISKMKGGGHGQSNIEFLEKNKIVYNINKVFENGVRVGNVPGHKVKAKRTGSNQSWFPENWTESDIVAAGTKISNSPEFLKAENGVAIFGGYNGVRVGVIKTNGEIGTIFPDATKQP